MTILLVQIFVLLLGAFLAGAVTACLFRRTFSGRPSKFPATTAGPPAPLPGQGSAASGVRFEKALTGGAATAVPPPFQSNGGPMIEVQPPAKAAAPVQPRFAPPSQPAPVAPPPQPKVTAPAPQPQLQPLPQMAPAPRVAPAPAAPATPPAAAVPTTPAELPTPPTRQAVPASQATSAPAARADTSQATYMAAAAAAAAATRSSPQPEAKAEPKAETPKTTPAPATSTGSQTYFGSLADRTPSATKTEDAAAAAPSAATGDDLTRIRSIDIEIQKRLRDIGVTTFAAIATWSPADVARVSQTLGYAGRIEAENWIEQAQILAQGTSGVEAQRKADKPKLEPQPASTFGSPFGADRLHRIIGIDGDTEKLLNAHGITKFAQIASWTGVEIEKVEEILAKPGRVGLENWVEQAKILSRGAVNEPLHATKLEDAIRSNAAKATAAAPETSESSSGGAPREIGHLRSVKSEALRRDPIVAYASATGVFDDLKRIRGVGLLIEKKLNSLGITTYEQIANWTGADIDRISQVLDFKGRIERENWIEQARILSSGGATDFSRRADRGEVETSRNRG